MGAGSFLSWLARWRRDWRGTARALVTALNAEDYPALERIVTDDLYYLDTMSNVLEGREAFVLANIQMRANAPDMVIVLDDFSEVNGELLVRGRMISSNPEYNSDSLWRARFSGNRICELQAYRDRNAVSLPLLSRNPR